MLERLRLLSWRYRRRAAILYLALLLTVFLAVGWYLHRLPGNLDVGLTVALRSLAYRGTFEDIELGR